MSAHRRGEGPGALHVADSVGADAQVRGSPHVENLGALHIGSAFRLDALAAPTHLVVAPGAVLRIGDGVQISHGCGVAAHVSVEIGDGAFLAPYVLVMDTSFHKAGAFSEAARPLPVRIGAGARIGAHVTIMPGATIGAGARVLPRSVVSGDVPAGETVAGVPARPLHVRSGEALTAAEVVQRTFRLPSAPLETLRPDEVPGWDSLGALHLLLALESEFEITLDEKALAGVRRVGDLEQLLAAARATSEAASRAR